MTGHYQVSQRMACRAVGISRSSYRYRPLPRRPSHRRATGGRAALSGVGV